MKLIGTRFVRFLWSVLPNTGILYSSLCQPAKVTFMDESASPIVTLHISSSPLRQSTLLFSNFFSCSLSFISPCFSLSLRLPDSHLPSHPSHGDYVSWRQGLRIRRWPQFSARFSHKNLKERKNCGRGRGLVSTGGHSETLEPSLKLCQSVWHGWKSVKGKAWWDFSVSVGHTFHS